MLHSNDTISLHWATHDGDDGLHYLAGPSLDDQNFDDIVHQKIQVTSVSSSELLVDEFKDRCIFRVVKYGVDNTHDAVHFGDTIFLVHESTGFYLCDHFLCSIRTINGDNNNNQDQELLESLWILQSKYKIKSAGDAIENSDFIVLIRYVTKKKFRMKQEVNDKTLVIRLNTSKNGFSSQLFNYDFITIKFLESEKQWSIESDYNNDSKCSYKFTLKDSCCNNSKDDETSGWQVIMVTPDSKKMESGLIYNNSLVRLQHCITRRYLILINDASEMKYICSTTDDATDPLNIFVLGKCSMKRTEDNSNMAINLNEYITFTHNESLHIPMSIIDNKMCYIKNVKSNDEFRLAAALCLKSFQPRIYRDIIYLRRFKLFLSSVKLLLVKSSTFDSNILISVMDACSNFLIWVLNNDYRSTKILNWEDFICKSNICVGKQNLMAHVGIQVELISFTFCIFDLSFENTLSDGFQNLCDEYMHPCLSISMINAVDIAHIFRRTEGCFHRLLQMFVHGWKVPLRALLLTISTQTKTIKFKSAELIVPLSYLRQLCTINEYTIDLLAILCYYNIYVDHGSNVKSFRAVVIDSLDVVKHNKHEIHSNLFSLRYYNGQWEIRSNIQIDHCIEEQVWTLWRDIEHKRLHAWLTLLHSVSIDKDITTYVSISSLLPPSFLVYMLHHSQKNHRILLHELIRSIYINCDLAFKYNNPDELYYFIKDNQCWNGRHRLLFDKCEDSDETRNILDCHITAELIEICLTPDNDNYNNNMLHTIKNLLSMGFLYNSKEMMLKLLLTKLTTYLKGASIDIENFINNRTLFINLLALCEFIIDLIYIEILQIDISAINLPKNYACLHREKLLQAVNNTNITELFLLVSCQSTSDFFAINLVNRFVHKQIFGYTNKLKQIRNNDAIIVGTSDDKEAILEINACCDVIKKYHHIYCNDLEDIGEPVSLEVVKLLRQCSRDISTTCRKYRMNKLRHKPQVIVSSSRATTISFYSLLNPLSVIHNGMVILYHKIMDKVDRNNNAIDYNATDKLYSSSYFIEHQYFSFDPMIIGEEFIKNHDKISQNLLGSIMYDTWNQIKPIVSNRTIWALLLDSEKIFMDIFLLIIVDVLSISNNCCEEIEQYLRDDNGNKTFLSISEWYNCTGMGKLAEYILTYRALDSLLFFPREDTTSAFFQSIFIRYGTDQSNSVTTCKLLLAILMNSSYNESKYGLAETALNNIMMKQECTFVDCKYGTIDEQYFFTLKLISKSLMILNLTVPDSIEKSKLLSCFKLKDGIILLCTDIGLIVKSIIIKILLCLYNSDAQLKMQLSYCFYNELLCIHKISDENCSEELYISVAEFIHSIVISYLHFFSSIAYDTEQYANNFILEMIEKSTSNVDNKNRIKREYILNMNNLKQYTSCFRNCADNIIPLSTIEGVILLMNIICDHSGLAKVKISDAILGKYCLIDEITLFNIIGKAYAVACTISYSDQFECKLLRNKLKRSAAKLIKVLRLKDKMGINKEASGLYDLLPNCNNITGIYNMIDTVIQASIVSNTSHQMNLIRELNTLKMVMVYIGRHENHALVVDDTINEILELIQTFLATDYNKSREIKKLLVSVGIIKSITNALNRFCDVISIGELRFAHNLIAIATLLIQKSEDYRRLECFTKGEFIRLQNPLNCMLVIMLKNTNTTYMHNSEDGESNANNLYVQILQFMSELAMNIKYFNLLFLPNDNVNIINTIVDICIALLQNMTKRVRYIDNPDLYCMQVESSTIPELNHNIILNSTSTSFVRKFIAFYDVTTDCNTMEILVTSLMHTYNILTKIIEGYNITFTHVFRDDEIKTTVFDNTLHLLEYFGALRLEGKILMKDNSTLNLSSNNPNKFISLYYHFLKKQDIMHHNDLRKIEAYHEGKYRTNWDKLLTICEACEVQVLKFITSLTNGRVKSTMTTLRGQYLDDEKSFVILMQNMDMLFTHPRHRALGVSYWAFFSQFNTKQYLSLERWKSSTLKGKSFNCSTIYIVDNNKRINKCVFLTPTIALLWDNYEVRRYKKLLTYYEIARVGSIELTMMSFFDAMKKLLTFMRRKQHQQLFINKYITCCIEMINLRFTFLVLTIILNVYYGLFLNYQPSANIPYNIRRLFGETSTYSLVPSIIPSNYPSAAPSLAYPVDNRTDLQRTVSNILASNVLQISAQISHLVMASLMMIAKISNSDEFDKLLKLRARCNYQKSAIFIYLLVVKYIWFIILLFCSISAAFTGNTFLYSIALLDIINQFPIMKYVVESIRRNIYRITATLILSFILLWMFSTINIVFFPPNSYNLNGHEACHLNLADCIKLHIDYGFINSPNWNNYDYNGTIIDDGNDIYGKGTGTIKTNIRGTNTGYPLITNFLDNIIASGFNLLYVLLINLVLQSIISGLIIDTFSSMRAEEDAKIDDIQNKCFVCNLPKDIIEKTEIFVDHIKDHYMWNYLFFKDYLAKKDPKSLSAPENFAYECLNSRQHFSQIMLYNNNLANQEMR